MRSMNRVLDAFDGTNSVATGDTNVIIDSSVGQTLGGLPTNSSACSRQSVSAKREITTGKTIPNCRNQAFALTENCRTGQTKTGWPVVSTMAMFQQLPLSSVFKGKKPKPSSAGMVLHHVGRLSGVAPVVIRGTEELRFPGFTRMMLVARLTR